MKLLVLIACAFVALAAWGIDGYFEARAAECSGMRIKAARSAAALVAPSKEYAKIEGGDEDADDTRALLQYRTAKQMQAEDEHQAREACK